MTRHAAQLLIAATMTAALTAAAAGCGPNGSPNPAQLWLALDGDELHAKLATSEPPPY